MKKGTMLKAGSAIFGPVVLLAMLTACATSHREDVRQGETQMESQAQATTFTLSSDREVAISRTFDVPREQLWAAWTSCDHLRKWLLGPPGWTMPVCEVDLREGGTQRFVWRGPEGEEMQIRGTYREVSPPARVVVVESWGGDWPETVNTLAFSERGSRTTLLLTIRYPSNEAREAALQTGMKDGMSHTFDRLAEYLKTMR